MFDNRISYYRSLAARLRLRAEETPFDDLRSGYLELARCFDRLADRAQRGPFAAESAAASGGEDD